MFRGKIIAPLVLYTLLGKCNFRLRNSGIHMYSFNIVSYEILSQMLKIE